MNLQEQARERGEGVGGRDTSSAKFNIKTIFILFSINLSLSTTHTCVLESNLVTSFSHRTEQTDPSQCRSMKAKNTGSLFGGDDDKSSVFRRTTSSSRPLRETLCSLFSLQLRLSLLVEGQFILHPGSISLSLMQERIYYVKQQTLPNILNFLSGNSGKYN